MLAGNCHSGGAMMTPGAKRVLLAISISAAVAGCATQHRLVASSSPCRSTTVTLYFESGSETLTSEGLEIVSLTAHRLAGCKVRELQLVGLADPTGSPQINLTLSQHRADNVLSAFVHSGLPVPKYTLVAAGQKGAVTASGAVEPVRRQVDATVVIER
jgi:outer membrane protein OmpA-like peptidoglycan-associated protein